LFNDWFPVEPDRYTDLNRLNKDFELRFEFLLFPPVPGRTERIPVPELAGSVHGTGIKNPGLAAAPARLPTPD
jgi:hypothetical protein